MASDSVFSIGVARAIVAGKIKNTRQVLLRGAREAAEPVDGERLSKAAEHLTGALRITGAAEDLDALRGAEGEAAKTYFTVFRHLVKPEYRVDFDFEGRSRRPPKDPMNALLSFLYSMLMNDCRSSVEAVGLDPQLGFLHAVRPGRASLALDLLEEFRAYIADRLALTLVNRSQLTIADFASRAGSAVLD
jgi:CRISPR-associated protein Cas1